MPDYGEIFCDAVQEIVSKELAGLSYDLTQVCEIIDNSEKNKGIYRVQTGQAKFQAYSSITTYEVGDTVYVVTPNNDINQQRIIIAKKITNPQETVTYVMPFNNLTIASNNLVDKTLSKSLVANNETTPEILLWSSGESESVYAGYSRLGLSAQFRSAIEEAVEGIYGLRLDFYAGDRKDPVASLSLNSNDMYGNPYNFNGFFKQQKVFDISKLPAFTRLDLYLYQENNFENINNEKIPWQDDIGNLVAPNIFVTEPEIYLGYNINDVYDKGLIIYTPQSIYYNDNGESKEIKWRFIRTLKNEKTELITNINQMPGYRILLYKYQNGAPIDAFAGADWIKVEEDFTSISFIPDATQEKSRYKALLIFNNKVIYESNILEFNNTLDLVEVKINKLLNNFQIKCLDETNGIYNWYGSGGSLLNPKDANKTRKLVPAFLNNDNLELEDKLEVINGVTKVKWIVPATNTMIRLKTNNEYIDLNNIIIEDKNIEDYIYKNYIEESLANEEKFPNYYLYKNYYYIYFFNPQKDSDQQISYTIEKDYIPTKTNNTISCFVTHNNLTPKAEKELTFSLAVEGEYKVTLKFEDGTDGFIFNDEGKKEKKKVLLNFYDSNGVEIEKDFTTKWYWWKSSDNNYTSVFDDFEKPSDNSAIIKFKKNDNNNYPEELPICYDTILAEVTYKTFTFQAVLGISIKDENIEETFGATEVVYTQEGLPQYSKENFSVKFKNLDENFLPILNFYIKSTYDEKDGMEGEDIYKPILQPIDNSQEYQLKLIETQVSDLKAAYSIVAEDENKKIWWSQPLIVIINNINSTASNNKENKSLDLPEVPEEGEEIKTISNNETNQVNIITSTISAGTPKTVNGIQTFTGVVLGNVSEKGETKDQAQYGLYGIQNNDITFSVRQNGSAYFKGTVEAENGYFNGELNATTGTIGKWHINAEDGSLRDEGGNIKLLPGEKQEGTVKIPGIWIGNFFFSEKTLVGDSLEISGVDVGESISKLRETDDTTNNNLRILDTELQAIEDIIYEESNSKPEWKNENKEFIKSEDPPAWKEIEFISNISLDNKKLTINKQKIKVLATFPGIYEETTEEFNLE